MKKSLVVKQESQVTPEIKREKGLFDTRTVVNTLEGLMNRVTEESVTPDTVNAACNCADKIVDILRLHLDVERLNRKSSKQEL
jgi:hypothetical protein